ncbi:hypothetical protein N9L06_02910 [Mariniblastus sp.]|nr:hypothetical protein [Mariniblastus sp.]
MNLDDPNLFSLSTLIRAARNYWFVALLVFALTVGLAVLAMIYLPKSYESEAMIFVKLGRETVSLDPTASTGSTISVLDTRDNEINSIRDMLYSRSIMEKIADRLGPDVILGDVDYTGETYDPPESPETDYKNSPRQKAILQLSEDTHVVSARKSSVMILHAEAPSPELAQRIVKEYLDVYQMMHTDAHQTPESNNFFKEQAGLLQVQWQESMKALQIAKEEAGVVSIDGARENLRGQTNDAQSNLMSVESRLAAETAKLKKFDRFIEDNPLDGQSIRDNYMEAKANVSAMTAEKKSLKTQVKQLLERAAKLNRNEVVIEQLSQEVRLAITNFAQYQELYEQTRIEEALHSSRFTNVRVVQEPTFVPKQISPKKTIIGLMGLMAGSTGGVMIALMLEVLFGRRPEDEKPVDDLEHEVLENNEFLTRPDSSRGVKVLDSANG